jgi:hypothetical protein
MSHQVKVEKFRCGNDSDGNKVDQEADMDRALSNDICKAISQVTSKFTSWTEVYLETCPKSKRANPLAKLPRMENNMKRRAGCFKDEE